MAFRPLAIALLASAALAGCTTVGPKYAGAPDAAPGAAARSAFLRGDAATTTATAPSARWWDALNDPVLGSLIDKGLANSPNIAAANARIAQARAGLAANKTALIPTLNVSGAVPYINVPSNILGGNDTGRTDTTIYNVGFDSSWELDLFGGTRSKITAAGARAEAAEAEDAGRIDALMRALQEIQFEILRMENQEAIIDGFGVMSGRIKGAAGR